MKNRRAEVDAAISSFDFSKNKYQVSLETNKGEIVIDMWPDVAPGHVKNLLGLTKIGYYDGLTFHRVIKGFMIQGGCPVGNGTGGPGYTIKAEFNAKPHEPGVISMARTQDPNSAGSQFFLCLERVPFLDNQYTVFGKAVDEKSLKTILTIGDSATGSMDRPVDTVTIKKASVIETPL
jgi:cyclophilin family peptidyl-prolyl cis-trans isomerase